MVLEASNLKVRVESESSGWEPKGLGGSQFYWRAFPPMYLEASNLKVAAAPRVY